jgi:hypothetical protein
MMPQCSPRLVYDAVYVSCSTAVVFGHCGFLLEVSFQDVFYVGERWALLFSYLLNVPLRLVDI